MARTYADVPARHETAGGGKEEEERQEWREEASTRHRAKPLGTTFLQG